MKQSIGCWVVTEFGDLLLTVGLRKNGANESTRIQLLGILEHKMIATYNREESETKRIMDALRSAVLEEDSVDIREIIEKLYPSSVGVKDTIAFPYRSSHCD